jgi:hypothetical protein
MQVNSLVQEIWLRLLGAADSSQAPRIERVEEGYYAVVHEAAIRAKCHASPEHEDFRAVKPFIPDLARTRAVYLNQEHAYGLTKIASLRDWAGHLGKPVEHVARHAFAVVDAEIFAREVSATFRASGWKVEHVEDSLRVIKGRFTENVNLLRTIVQMVLSRSAFAEASLSLKTELDERFLLDAQFFARFKERFAQYRPAVLDRYFTVCPDCSRLAAGWDYWQVSNRNAHDAAEIFEQAMKEFEILLAMPPEDWLPPFASDCCEQSNTEN